MNQPFDNPRKKKSIGKFLFRIHKPFYYFFALSIPASYWIYLFIVGIRIEDYYPERTYYTIFEEKHNVAYFMFSDGEINRKELSKMRNFRREMCSTELEWDKWNKNFFVFATNERNNAEIEIYYLEYPEKGNILDGIINFEHLQLFEYAYFLNLGRGKISSASICEEMLGDFVISTKGGKYVGTTAGGTREKFLDLAGYLNDKWKNEDFKNSMRDTEAWTTYLQEYVEDRGIEVKTFDVDSYFQ